MIAASVSIVLFAVPGSEAAAGGIVEGTLCNLQKAPCLAVTTSGIEVQFDISPRPVKAMQDLEFQVALRKHGMPVTGASLLLDLSMPGMYMGNNQPRLTEQPGGIYRGRGVIPYCLTGLTTWKALLAVGRSDKIETVTFQLEVQ